MDNERTITLTRRVTAAAQAAARENGAKAKPVVQSEEHRAKLREGQAARRERERQEREAAASVIAPVDAEPKRPGRPRTRPQVEPTGEKRGRGRPKKQDGQTSAQTTGAAVRGTQEAGTA